MVLRTPKVVVVRVMRVRMREGGRRLFRRGR
jgi:hypothetical protein